MAFATYSNKTLEKNWYEDRWAPQQDVQKYPHERVLREHEDAISSLHATGIAKPLGCIKRMKKWNTAGVVPDDGFREAYTIQRTEFPDPRAVSAVINKRPPNLDQTSGATKKVINAENIAALTLVDREVSGPSSGFGSLIPRHEATHDKRYFETTNQAFYGRGSSAPRRTQAGNSDFHFTTTSMMHFTAPRDDTFGSAGLASKSKFDELAGIAGSDKLVAEQLRKNPDPQHNTVIQRSWMYTADPGVTSRLKQTMNLDLPATDNENSLPLGLGAYASRPKANEPGAYRHKRMDVTMQPREHMEMNFR